MMVYYSYVSHTHIILARTCYRGNEFFMIHKIMACFYDSKLNHLHINKNISAIDLQFVDICKCDIILFLLLTYIYQTVF